MQMEYRDCVINLLDTPGHQDFSEDTYRVLTAVDAALMVIDAANGVEPQTRRLLQVCRARNTPILTFVNKMDREVREPLALMDEIERELGMPVVPFTWPVGMGKRFHGVMDLREQRMRVFAPGEDRRPRRRRDPRRPRQPGVRRALRRRVRRTRSTTSSWCSDAAPSFDEQQFLARPADADVLRLGDQQLRRARGARRAGRPGAAAGRRRPAMQREVQPDEPKFSGVVFKIQANMDPAHRDRIAFVRVASGHFERGMRLKVVRSGKELRPNTVVSLPVAAARAARRGLCRRHHRHPQPRRAAARRHAHRRRGAAVHRPAVLRARDVPLGRGGRPAAAPSSCKPGLTQLGEEGAIQVFRPVAGTVLLLGAVGQLQFEVVAHRLEHEYGVKARITPARYADRALGHLRDDARRSCSASSTATRTAWRYDAVDAPTLLVEYAPELRAIEEQLAEDQVPRAARARRAGVPAAPFRLTSSTVPAQAQRLPPCALPRPDPLGPPGRLAAAAVADAVARCGSRPAAFRAGTCWRCSCSARS